MFLPKINSRFCFFVDVHNDDAGDVILRPCYTLLMMLLILCGGQPMIKVTSCCFMFIDFVESIRVSTVQHISIHNDLGVYRDFIRWSIFFVLNMFNVLLLLFKLMVI